MQDITIRFIQPKDNVALAKIIRSALEEFNANKPGTVYFDNSTDHLYELFTANKNAVYFVAESNGEILGGAGIYPTDGLPEGVCELVKMYLHKNARGKGTGRFLIGTCLQKAKGMGYRQVYLETMPELSKAVSVYEKFGFRYLDAAMGASGHTDCTIWMLKDL
ncbi:MAG: GNAT family N-acetyltransferase [Sphingobacteriales bacterium]|uniref:GNAT family N-acetyltransferase n=1 Tax=Hydrotalea flava TaxID=714549 RepID=UPI00082B4F9A|nr:GNAT family N-acetyltransferase [Hydrotalea flava]RTL51991.1 MAG: GNAT family N-acetyltransferase [Sphingobacteriales bacterium]